MNFVKWQADLLHNVWLTVNVTKVLKTAFPQNTSKQLLLKARELCKYIFIFYDLGKNLQIFFYFRILVHPILNVNSKGKHNSENIQQVKIRLNLNASYVSLTIATIFCTLTLQSHVRHNVSNLHQNKVNTVLANCLRLHANFKF